MKQADDKGISVLSYFKVKRFIEFNVQKVVRTEHSLILSKQAISAEHQQFPIVDIFDLSYKPFSDNSGLLYLHTRQGVFAFDVDTNPSVFMEKALQQIKNGGSGL